MTSFLSGLATSLVLSVAAVAVLRRLQFLDVPNHRSSHDRPVPRGGGTAVVLAIAVLAAAQAEHSIVLTALLLTTVTLAAVGLMDDLRSLSSSVRLGAQLLAALSLVAVLLHAGSATWWWLPALVVAVVGYVNAYNFMDGINGISALTAVVVGGWWAWVGHLQGHDLLYVLGLLLAGTALGFLPWNAPNAKVFLGDVGSYGLGVFIAGLSAVAITSGLPWHWALAPLVVYGADTGWVLVKRWRGGRPLAEAHREHVYQRLVDSGWSHLLSATWCAVAGAGVCAVTLAGGENPAWWAAALAAVIVLAYLSTPALYREKAPA